MYFQIGKEMKKAMSMVEYCVLITVVVAAFIAMQIYFKRAICGRWKTAGDTLGFGRQFDPASTTVR